MLMLHRFQLGLLLLLLLSGPSFSYFTGFGVKTSGWRQTTTAAPEPLQYYPLVYPAEGILSSTTALQATVQKQVDTAADSKTKSAKSFKNSTDEEDGDSSSGSTKNSGHKHTDISRAKISASNKGRTPWNAGRQHSEETKALIAAKTREAMARKKLKIATDLGLTLEEHEQKKEEERKVKRVSKLKGGLTELGRQRISESQKRRWEDPAYRIQYSLTTRGKRNHTEETKAKLSIAIKEKWKTDEYRNIKRPTPSPEVRARISATLKAKWQDNEFREKMQAISFARTPEYRAALSMKIREKWAEPEYRNSVESAIRNHFQEFPRSKNNATAARVRAARKPSSGGPPGGGRRVKTTAQQLEERKLRKQITAKKAAIRKEAFKQAKKQAKETAKLEKKMGRKAAASAAGSKKSLKTILGKEIWFEEKMKRSGKSSVMLDDESLEKALAKEFTSSPDEEEEEDEEDEEDEDDEDEEDDDDDDDDMSIDARYIEMDEEVGFDNMYLDDDYELGDEEDDYIEVFDEDGELVGTYNADQLMKNKNRY